MCISENYLKDPNISWLFDGPIDNEKLNEVYCLIEGLAKYKINCFKHEYEDLDISTDATFCWEDRTATLIYNSKNDNEHNQAYRNILECLFIIISNLFALAGFESICNMAIPPTKKSQQPQVFSLLVIGSASVRLGSLITVVFICFTLISVSCLHLEQKRGKFSSMVSSRSIMRVLL